MNTTKVLFIDDDDIFHFINEKIIHHAGVDCEIRVASNGREALNIMSNDEGNIFIPDYIFVDLNMPVMDGFTFIQNFRTSMITNKDRIKIIILTSSDSIDDRLRAKEMGIGEYLVKPLEGHLFKGLLLQSI